MSKFPFPDLNLALATPFDAAADLAVAHWELSRTQMESFVTPQSIDIPLGKPPAGKRKGRT